MNQIEIGKFIARQRKAKNLTQAQLAEMLNISDRAVSKWERGINLPDSSLMLPLCGILEITADELLGGGKTEAVHSEKKERENPTAPPKSENKTAANIIISVCVSSALAIGILVCIICNIALSGGLTWSLIPIASMAYAWAVVFPGLITGNGKPAATLMASLAGASIFTIPYLYVLSVLTGVRPVFIIGASAAAAALIFLWIIAAVFIKLGKTRKRAAFGTAFLLAVPFEFAVNLLLFKLIGEPIFDVWDMLTIFILLIISFICFISQKTESGKM